VIEKPARQITRCPFCGILRKQAFTHPSAPRGVPAPRAATRQARSRGSTPRSTGVGSAGCSRCGHPLLGRRARGPSSPNRKSNARARADGPAGDSEFFLERGARANIKKTRKILRRAGKEPPKEGDELLDDELVSPESNSSHTPTEKGNREHRLSTLLEIVLTTSGMCQIPKAAQVACSPPQAAKT
jgi:hypothetical protein